MKRDIEEMSFEEARKKLQELGVLDSVKEFLESEEAIERMKKANLRSLIFEGKFVPEEDFIKSVHSKLICRVAEILLGMKPKKRQQMVCKIKSLPNLIFWQDFDEIIGWHL